MGAEIELRQEGGRTYFVQASEGIELFDVRAVPGDHGAHVPACLLDALHTVGLGTPGLAGLARETLTRGDTLTVAFRPEIRPAGPSRAGAQQHFGHGGSHRDAPEGHRQRCVRRGRALHRAGAHRSRRR